MRRSAGSIESAIDYPYPMYVPPAGRGHRPRGHNPRARRHILRTYVVWPLAHCCARVRRTCVHGGETGARSPCMHAPGERADRRRERCELSELSPIWIVGPVRCVRGHWHECAYATSAHIHGDVGTYTSTRALSHAPQRTQLVHRCTYNDPARGYGERA